MGPAPSGAKVRERQPLRTGTGILQGKLPPAIAGQQGHIIPGKDVGVLGGDRQALPGIKDPEVRAELGVLVEEQEEFQGAERRHPQHPLDGGVGAAGQQFPPEEPGQGLGVKAGQPRQVLAVLFADVLADLGLPAAAGLKMPQGHQVVGKIQGGFAGVQLFLASTR